jgi:GH24 family phage-related lysozyme (muramidase)
VNRASTETLVKNHEGLRFTVYYDIEGHPTIGIGFNLDKEGARDRITAVHANYDRICAGEALTESQVSALFAIDLEDAIQDATGLVANFADHPDPIQSVIIDMIFNLGSTGFAKFEKTIAAFERKDYSTAAAQMADSKWAEQVPNRAREDIDIVMGFCHV